MGMGERLKVRYGFDAMMRRAGSVRAAYGRKQVIPEASRGIFLVTKGA